MWFVKINENNMTLKLEKLFKIALYILVVFLIGTYLLGKAFDCRYLLSFTNFDSNSGILWIVILSLVLAHIPTLKSIIREIASNRVAHLADDEIVKLFEERINTNEDFFRLVSKRIGEIREKDSKKGIPAPEGDISSGSQK
jgi:hypothetical protein